MTSRHRFVPVVLGFVAAAGLSAGCDYRRVSNTVGPSSSDAPSPNQTAPSLVGQWISLDSTDTAGVRTTSSRPAATLPSLSACADFNWNIQTQSGATASGPFVITCAGPIVLSGAGTGEILSPTSVRVSITGIGHLPDVASCSFSLTGVGELQGDTIRIPFSGSTCFGPVTGSTRIHRNVVMPPAPPSPPNPAPPPPPPPSPGIPCASNDGEFIAECIEGRYPERRMSGVSLAQRIADMEFLRDRIIEAGRCGGLDLAWNLKRGTGPRSTDALAWRRVNGAVDVVDVGSAYDDTSQPLRLQWVIVAGPPGYEGYPSVNCR